MFKKDYDKIIRENFDLSDGPTRRYIVSLDEAEEDQLLSALSLSMYNSITSNVDDIDFGSIPMSRGDITKVEGFDGTEECLRTMRALVLEYKQNPSVVDVVLTTIQNVKDDKHLFVKAFALNAEFPILLYNLIVLSIERATSLMIATCVQFAKDPSSSTPKKALDKVAYQRTMDDMMFNQLITINNLFKNGTMNKVIEETMKKLVKEDTDVMQYGIVAPVTEPEAGENNDASDPSDLFGTNDDTSNPESNNIPTSDNNPTISEPECGDVEDITADIRPQTPQTTPELQNNYDPAENPACAADETGSSMQVDMVVGDGDTQTSQSQNVDLSDWEKEPEPTEETNDSVDTDNIPAVVPGDDITDSNSTINEDEVQEEGVKNIVKKGADVVVNGFFKNKKVPMVAKILGAAALTLGVSKAAKELTIGFLIPKMRTMVFYYNYSRMKVSDYLEVQADLLEANANELEYSNDTGMDDEKRNKVISKQRKTIEKLRKWSNIFNIDKKHAENETKKAEADVEKNKKKVAKDEDGDYALF